MAKLTVKPIDPPKPPPKVYILEMNEEEATVIKTLLGRTPGTDDISFGMYPLLDNEGISSKQVFERNGGRDSCIAGCLVVK